MPWPQSVFRSACVLVMMAAAGWWLFADTARFHYGMHRSGDEITFSYWGGFEDHQLWSEVIAAFETVDGRTQVRPQWLPLSAYTTKMQQAMLGGVAPDAM